MIKAKDTVTKERIWINRVASEIVFQRDIQTLALRKTPNQRDVTSLKRSGEWLNMESRNCPEEHSQ